MNMTLREPAVTAEASDETRSSVDHGSRTPKRRRKKSGDASDALIPADIRDQNAQAHARVRDCLKRAESFSVLASRQLYSRDLSVSSLARQLAELSEIAEVFDVADTYQSNAHQVVQTSFGDRRDDIYQEEDFLRGLLLRLEPETLGDVLAHILVAQYEFEKAIDNYEDTDGRKLIRAELQPVLDSMTACIRCLAHLEVESPLLQAHYPEQLLRTTPGQLRESLEEARECIAKGKARERKRSQK